MGPFPIASAQVRSGEGTSLLLRVRDGLPYLPERNYDANARSLDVCRDCTKDRRNGCRMSWMIIGRLVIVDQVCGDVFAGMKRRRQPLVIATLGEGSRVGKNGGLVPFGPV